VPVPGDVVAQQRRRLVQVDHEHVHVPVVVEVAEGAAAAGVHGGHARSRLLDQLLERPSPRLRNTRRGVRKG
jgi:hypothetical protein